MKVRSLAGVLLLTAVGVAGAESYPGAIRTKFPTGTTLPIGEYPLDRATASLTDLVEFSSAQYAAMGRRQFEGETDYKARPAAFSIRALPKSEHGLALLCGAADAAKHARD